MVERSSNPANHLARGGLAGFVGGYVMMLAGYWLEAVFGLSELDFAHSSLRFVAGGKQGWWVMGTIFHLIDSIILGLLYMTIVRRRLAFFPKLFGPFFGNIARGATFALGVWLVMAMLIGMPFMGAGIFGRKTGSPRPALASLSLHLLFGTLVGLIADQSD